MKSWIDFARELIPANVHPSGKERVDLLVVDLWDVVKDIPHEHEWIGGETQFCRLCGKEKGTPLSIEEVNCLGIQSANRKF